MKKTLAAIIGIALFSFVGVSQVSALSTTEIQAQIQSLLAQIETLKAQIKALQEVKPVAIVPVEAPASCKVWYDGCNTCSREYPGGPLSCTEVQCIWNAGAKCQASFENAGNVPSRICALAAPYLRKGISGADVAVIQEFLASEGLLKAGATGYFGAATEAALKEWQAREGIVSGGSAATTGWGVIGPRTWEILKKRCAPESDKLVASPQRGSAPLTVEFKAQVNPTNDSIIADAGYYKIVFGDGAEHVFTCTDPSGTCRPPSVSHTYAVNGSYTAKLIHYGFFGLAGANEVVVGRAQIIVGDGGGIACTKEYAPVCGRPSGCANTCPPGMYCAMLCQLPEPQTYSNKCMLKAAGAEYLYDGACRDWSTGKPPVVSGLSGPTTLSVGETGTWRITASDPENQSLSYAVTWGDEHVYPAAMMDRAVSSAVFYQDTTFTHSYAAAGVYTITVVVTDASGQSAKTSTTVRVGAAPVACTMEYAPVCGQKTVCPACITSNPACMAPCALQQQTYGNKCMMNADGATFAYGGECR